MHRTTITSIAVAAMLGLAACGGDGDPEATAATAGPGDVERYCALGREMDRAGSAFFAKLERDENAGEEEFAAAERAFVAKYAREFEQIETAAPAEIRDEVRTILAAQRERAGLETSRISEAASGGAEAKIKAFEKRECG